MFANDGILSKRLVLILIRVYQQRSAWHCADTDFINNKKCKWKIWQDGVLCKATASSKRSVNFPNIIELEPWLYSLLSKLVLHFTAVLTAIMRKIYKLPVRNHICLYKNFDHQHYLNSKYMVFQERQSLSTYFCWTLNVFVLYLWRECYVGVEPGESDCVLQRKRWTRRQS